MSTSLEEVEDLENNSVCKEKFLYQVVKTHDSMCDFHFLQDFVIASEVMAGSNVHKQGFPAVHDFRRGRRLRETKRFREKVPLTTPLRLASY